LLEDKIYSGKESSNYAENSQRYSSLQQPYKSHSSLFSSPIFSLIFFMFSSLMFSDSLQIVCHVMWM